jgi:uncharacterized protein YjiS (DUF1127 family)
MTTIVARSGLRESGLEPRAMRAADAARADGPAPLWRSLLRRWLDNRAARRRLAECARLDRRFAQDIGLSEAQLAAECDAWFWAPLPRAAIWEMLP